MRLNLRPLLVKIEIPQIFVELRIEEEKVEIEIFMNVCALENGCLSRGCDQSSDKSLANFTLLASYARLSSAKEATYKILIGPL